ncbi:DUF898 domain-containing protein [Roseateles sp. DAIF2]|uniref:YjgN family protein n=1 Tax=Roseateles sp. DAIF2 TaxID=2714952 RepID=UPI0018A2C5B7|nr:YjgN family protein [Roseateles sp. DAIF2]QPF75964.1 DUF898 domain-containing protein [Roseateles sp. DAIF2]
MQEQSTFGHSSHAPARFFRIEFTGSGSEYFRIWIVNLLLSLVTLGLYIPFAKARRLRYFYSNTLIDGQALAFHGNPWRMFRGFVLLALLMAAYALSGQFSPLAGLVAFLILCAIWPALWRASLQFRLANTSWRGLRFGFRGGLAGAYRAFLPTYLPALVIVAVGAWWPEVLQDRTATELTGPHLAVLSASLALMLLGPWTLALSKIYQHGHYALANQHSRTDLGVGAFYILMLKYLGWTLAYLLLAGGLLFILTKLAGAWLLVPLVVLLYLGLLALVWPYLTVRLQNLVWNRTRSEDMRFESGLSLRSFAWLSLKNWLLTLITLGLYRPFAAINSTRLRLEAVQLLVRGDLDAWVAEQALAQPDAAGDAAGDFFGIDMGL